MLGWRQMRQEQAMHETRVTRVAVTYRNDGATPRIGGYAAKYNTYSQNLGGFVEQIAPGAFDRSLSEQVDVLCRYNHEDAGLLGRTNSGTLRLTSDSTGLEYEVDLPDTSTGRDVAELARRGDVTRSSFAFHTLEDDWSLTDQGFPRRTLRNVALVDVAPVVSPAYLDTSSALRSLADRLEVDANEVPALQAAGEIAARLRAPTVIDIAPRVRIRQARQQLLALRAH